ncbi:MAG: glutamyl-tRNA reductase [Planctomycetota bacterium]|nr:glutamyl-tRNA reductase [Planctomycetota bacterium]
MKVQLVGVSHHTAPIQLRQRLAFRPEQVPSALDGLRDRFPQTEAVLLSTCNRVEVYTAVDEDQASPSHQDVVHFLADFHHVAATEIFDELFERTGEDAVRHLFYVAASLDSMVVGEAQILGQVKQAYVMANQAGATGPLTHGFFQAALKTARRVAAETTINQRRTSVAGVAVADFAKQIFERFDDKKILVIGAGEMGDDALRYLRHEGGKDITVVSRTLETAANLAGRWSGTAVPWEQLDQQLIAADLVISTTGASQPVVTLQDFQRIEPQRYQRPICILDLAVPRDFESAVGDRLGVYLYSIDDLQEICRRNRTAREKEWPAAERIIEEEATHFMAELNHRATAPTIRRLRDSCEVLKRDELQRLHNKLPGLDDAARQEIQKTFDRFLNKMLHPPLESLRNEARSGTSHGLLEALRRLFQIKD